MSDYRRIGALVLIMSVVALAIGGIAIWVLYGTAFDQKRADLAQKAMGRGQLIEVVLQLVEAKNPLDDPLADTIRMISDAHDAPQDYSDMGEFLVGAGGAGPNRIPDASCAFGRGQTGARAPRFAACRAHAQGIGRDFGHTHRPRFPWCPCVGGAPTDSRDRSWHCRQRRIGGHPRTLHSGGFDRRRRRVGSDRPGHRAVFAGHQPNDPPPYLGPVAVRGPV